MTLTADEAAMLAAIRADPDDDTARLAYADYLDERPAVRMECPGCKGTGCGKPTYQPVAEAVHSECGGRLTRHPHYGNERPDDRWCERCWHVVPARHTGFEDCAKCGRAGQLLDTSATDRAELIRLQCGVAQMPAGCLWPKEVRESAILAARPEWFPPCPTRAGCAGTNYCPADACTGSGRVGTFTRGFLAVPVPSLETVFDYPKSARGKRYGQRVLTPWGRALRDGFPHVVGVEVRDREPWRGTYHGAGHWFDVAAVGRHFFGHTVREAEALPRFLWELLPGGGRVGHLSWQADTPEAARAALAAAVAIALFAHSSE